VLVLVAAASAGTRLPAAQETRVLPAGTWGGGGISMTVTTTGAHLEFDCASGDINRRIVLDGRDRFALDGVLIKEHGGGLRQGETPDRQAARYAAQLTDKTIVLDVTLAESGASFGHFTLTLDAPARVRKCR
jgi:hypothetical protein